MIASGEGAGEAPALMMVSPIVACRVERIPDKGSSTRRKSAKTTNNKRNAPRHHHHQHPTKPFCITAETSIHTSAPNHLLLSQKAVEMKPAQPDPQPTHANEIHRNPPAMM